MTDETPAAVRILTAQGVPEEIALAILFSGSGFLKVGNSWLVEFPQIVYAVEWYKNLGISGIATLDKIVFVFPIHSFLEPVKLRITVR